MAGMPTSIKIAQVIGITAAGFASGGISCISYLNTPSLLLAPHPLVLKQFKKSYDIGKVAHMTIAVISMSAYGYLAYQMKGTLNQHKAELYGLAVLSTSMMWPWTIFGMIPLNKKIFEKVDAMNAVTATEEVMEADVLKGESAKELIDRWATFNAVRGLFLLTSTALGVWATIS